MKILIIQQKKIGDVLTTSILFEALRKKYPDAELHYLIYRDTRPVIENNPFIYQIIEYDAEIDKNPIEFLKFLRGIGYKSYDVVIDAYSKISSGIISKYSGAPIRLGFHKKYTQQFYTHTFKYQDHPETNAGLAIENRMLLLQALDSGFPKESKPVIYLSDSEKLEIGRKLLRSGLDQNHSIIMCGVLGSTKEKSYPLRYMAKVLDEIIVQLENAQILFNYLPSQKNQAQEVFNYCSDATKLRIFKNIYEKELRGFILNCACCDLFIGNEGGAANIAKALNIPTFSIYSPLIKKHDWAIYEDGERNISIHPEDYSANATQSHKDYGNLKPELFRSALKDFLHKNIRIKTQKSS